MLPMYNRISIQSLLKQGHSKKELSNTFDCHRNTIRNIGKEKVPKEKYERESTKHLLDTHKEYVKKLLDDNLSIIVIQRKLLNQKNCEVGYHILQKYIKRKKLKIGKVYKVLHSEPGEEGQVDFGYFGLTPDNNGKLRKTWVFVMTLSHSRHNFAKTVYNQEVNTFINCHIEAFEYFGGVPKTIKIDNLKAAILEANFYEPIHQKDYLAFSNHYGFDIITCKVRAPEEKGKVESGVKYVKNNFFKGSEFKNRNDLENKLMDWLNNTCNSRVHGTTRKIPRDVFNELEKKNLNKLPLKRWEIFSYEKRKVGKTSHIMVGKNYYSVPYKYILEVVIVNIGEKLIKIYSGKLSEELIATHVKLLNEGEYQTNIYHYPDYLQNSDGYDYVKYLGSMKEIGRYAGEYFIKLHKLNPTSWKQKTRGILSLRKGYTNEEINISCKRAINYEVYTFRVIQNICSKGLYNDKIENFEESIKNEKSIGKDNNQLLESSLQRPLSYYSNLLITYFILVIYNIWK